jgi:WD40 repeat protein
MSKRKTLFILFPLLIIAFSVNTIFAQENNSNDKAPYIYYYSRLHNAFIIERADGTDGILLGEDLMPDEHSLVWDVGWSPSGEWLTWISTPSAEYAQAAMRSNAVWAIRHDGSERLTILDDIGWTSEIKWSPTADILILTNFLENSFDVHTNTSSRTMGLYVIDVERQEIIFSKIFDYGIRNILWTPNGNRILFTDGDNTYRLSLLDATIQTLPSAPIGGYNTDGTSLMFDEENQMLIVENYSNNIEAEIPLPTPYISYAEWSPDGNHALLITHPETFRDRTNPEHGLWILSVSDMSLQLVFDNASSPNPPIGYYNQKPLTLWLPEGSQAFFPTADGMLYQYNLADNSIRDTSLPPFPPINEETGATLTVLSTQWMDDYGFILWADRVWVYDLDTGRFSGDSFGRLINFGVSADEHYVAQNGVCNEEFHDRGGHCIWDWQNNHNATISPTSVTIVNALSSNAGDVLWHDTENWVLLADTIVIRVYFPYWSIANADGTIHRELTACDIDVKCAGWLPDTVDTSHILPNETPLLTQPAMILSGHDGQVYEVAWSPDGSKIASAGMDGEVHIWDVATGETIQTLSTSPTTLSWGADNNTLAMTYYDRETETSTAKIWNLDTESVNVHYDNAYSIVFSPDGSLLALGTAGGTITISDTTTGATTAVLAGHDNAVLHMEFSNDGTRLATASNGIRLTDITVDIRVWDVTTSSVFYTENTPIFSWKPEKVDYLMGLELSPDGKSIMISTWYGEQKVFDIETGKIISNHYAYLLGFTMNHSPNGRYIADVIPFIRILDTTTEEIIGRYYSGGLDDVAWSPDSTRIAVASGYLVRIWEVPR